MVGFSDLIPFMVFGVFVFGIWSVLSMISQRNSRAQERLTRMSRPASLVDIDTAQSVSKEPRMQGIMDTAKALSKPLMPQTELEQSALKIRLANAGFRSDSAMAVYLGLRFASTILFALVSLVIFLPRYGITFGGLKWVVILTGIGFYLPQIILWQLRRSRQQAICLSLAAALDLRGLG